MVMVQRISWAWLNIEKASDYLMSEEGRIV